MKKLVWSSIVLCMCIVGIVSVAQSGSAGSEVSYLPLVVNAEPTHTPTPVPTAVPTAEPTPDPPTNPPATEMVVFTWDGPVTKSDRGFPREEPPKVNGDWTSPVNFAEGTMYVRFEVVNQPVPQDDMKLQFCLWQAKNGNNFALETCLWTKNVPGRPGTIKCWSQEVDKFFKKGGKSLEWDRPRFRAAIPIKNGAGKAVSDYNGWNWNGENPNEWYPLNLKATVVLVAKGAVFSGWENYGGGC